MAVMMLSVLFSICIRQSYSRIFWFQKTPWSRHCSCVVCSLLDVFCFCVMCCIRRIKVFQVLELSLEFKLPNIQPYAGGKEVIQPGYSSRKYNFKLPNIQPCAKGKEVILLGYSSRKYNLNCLPQSFTIRSLFFHLKVCSTCWVCSIECLSQAPSIRRSSQQSFSKRIHSKKKSTSEHLFWCFRLSQIEDSIRYLEGQMDPKVPIIVLPGTIWSFQVLNRVLYLWLPEAPKKVLWSTFLLRVYCHIPSEDVS